MRGGASVGCMSHLHPNGRMMADSPRSEWRVALLRAGEHRCALPLSSVSEVMRPQPVSELPNVPAYVRGVAIIRGRPTPVVDLGALLGESPIEATRLISLKTGPQPIALAVEAVDGIADLAVSSVTALPGLLSSVEADFASELAVLDGRLFAVLEASRLLSAEVWAACAAKAETA